MENIEINFIGYQHRDFITKIEIGAEEEHDAPFSCIHNEESREFSFDNLSQNHFSVHNKPNEYQNIFNASFNSNLYPENFEKPRKHPPFKIIRKEPDVKREETISSEEKSMSAPSVDKIANKSRRIMKREKAKQRSLAKGIVLAPAASAMGISDKDIAEGFDQPDLDDKSKKKMVQMIRNRLSAQTSRDKKKAYLKKLENHQKKISAENVQYQNEIRQLKHANEALKNECEYLRKCLVSAGGETHQYKPFLSQGISEISKNQDMELGAEFRSRPYTRRSHATSQLFKYSLTLATVFAVLMFSNVNLPDDSNFLQMGQQSNQFESQLQESYFRRILAENAVDFSKVSNELGLKTEMEQEISNSDGNSKTNQTFEELRKLKNIFHEDYMSNFMSQLKVNASEDLELTNNITFPKYLKKSVEERQQLNAAESEKSADDSTHQNYSALFCPSGFAIDTLGKETTPKDAFNIKMEEEMRTEAKKEMKLNKSDWLQLIVPRSNLLPTYIADPENIKISSERDCKNEDRSLIELWCKIVNVRTLQSGL